MTGFREIIATLIAAAALAALTLVVTGQPSPRAVSMHLSAAQKAHPACDWHVFHRIDAYTSWRYVDPRLAAYEHVGPCAKVITGTDGSVVFSQRGYAIDVS